MSSAETPQTIRSLARQLHLSPTTVSEALRGKPRVAPATTGRVQAAAEAAGYHRNLLAGRVMSQVRSGAINRFRGALALLDIEEPQRPLGAAEFNGLLADGAARRATALGFSVDRFLLGPGGLPPGRLNQVLLARSIGGVLILPAFDEVHLEALDWSRLSGVYLDRVIRHPRLHSVSPDHFGAMSDALQILVGRGYRRPGLVLQKQQDFRLQRRWMGAFLAFCHEHSGVDHASFLVAEHIDESLFARWFRKHRHGSHLTVWMQRAGARVPAPHGFVSLNAVMCATSCAAIDLQPTLLGARGVEMLVGQMLQGDFGPPAVASNTSVPAVWRDGLTIRPAGSAASGG